MIVVEQADGKTLENIFRTKNLLLKMLIRKAFLELRSLRCNEVWKCAAYLVVC